MQLPAFLERISWAQVTTPIMNMFRKRRLASFVRAYPDLANYSVSHLAEVQKSWQNLHVPTGQVSRGVSNASEHRYITF